MQAPFISVVCPALNEEENIAGLCEEWISVLRNVGETFEVILVDDGSSDGTRRAMQQQSERFSEIVVLQSDKRQGQSAALAAGFDAAQGDIVATSDADLQNDPRDLPRLLALLDEYDVVCGSRQIGVRTLRVVCGCGSWKDQWLRCFVSRIANRIIRLLFGHSLKDAGCGLKVMRREVAVALLRFDAMHRFIPTLAHADGFRVTELVVNHRPRVSGSTKYNISSRLIRTVYDLIGLSWYLRRRVQPNYASTPSTQETSIRRSRSAA